MLKRIGIILLFVGISVSTLFAQNFQVSGSNSHSVMICSNGNIFAWGHNELGQLGVQSDGTTPTAGTLPLLQLGFMVRHLFFLLMLDLVLILWR